MIKPFFAFHDLRVDYITEQLYFPSMNSPVQWYYTIVGLCITPMNFKFKFIDYPKCVAVGRYDWPWTLKWYVVIYIQQWWIHFWLGVGSELGVGGLHSQQNCVEVDTGFLLVLCVLYYNLKNSERNLNFMSFYTHEILSFPCLHTFKSSAPYLGNPRAGRQ